VCSVVADRKAHPTEKKDLLNSMLNGRDSKTGQGLSDDNITKNASCMLSLLNPATNVFSDDSLLLS
jgi:cytochrome P450/NADPH-cytochrome P450 reductase